MKTLARLITTSIIAILMTSCNFLPGVSGDGNVITENRKIESEFTNINVSRGIDVILTQGNSTSLKVEADQNLQDIITTEFNAAKKSLRISATKNIKSSSSKKVYVTVKDIYAINTTSGARVISDDTFNLKKVVISSTSGSIVELQINAETVKLNSTSGAVMDIEGSASKLSVSATSGSHINAENLKAESTSVSATSGANIKVSTSKSLTASATSGAVVKYKGSPKNVSKSNGIFGSIKSL